MKLYTEMRTAMAKVMEAEEFATEWKKVANERMKQLHNLIRAEEIASGVKLDKKTVMEQLRAEIAPAPVENEQPDNLMAETYSEPDPAGKMEADAPA